MALVEVTEMSDSEWKDLERCDSRNSHPTGGPKSSAGPLVHRDPGWFKHWSRYICIDNCLPYDVYVEARGYEKKTMTKMAPKIGAHEASAELDMEWTVHPDWKESIWIKKKDGNATGIDKIFIDTWANAAVTVRVGDETGRLICKNKRVPGRFRMTLRPDDGPSV